MSKKRVEEPEARVEELETRMEELETRIAYLWNKRPDLPESEWTEFAQAILNYLRNINYSHYTTLKKYYPSGDTELRQQFIEDFFVAKIFHPTTKSFKPNVLRHARVLRSFYYPGFLVDQIRRAETRLKYEDLAASTGHVSPEEIAGPEEQLLSEDTSFVVNGDQASADCELDDAFRPEPEFDHVKQSASEFIDQFSEKGIHWVLLYLGGFQCVDEANRPALYALARQHQIRSYAYKAKILGITKPHGGYAREAPWADTLLGKWLQSVGIPREEMLGGDPTRHWREQIIIALKILCSQALMKVQGKLF